MSKASFQLVYDGPAFAENEMAARDLSSALIAMDALFGEADRVVNKGKTETTLTVKASFKTGSFRIDLNTVQGLVDRVKDLLSSQDATAILNAEGLVALVVAGVLLFKKWLKGRKITKIEPAGTKLRVFVGGDYLDVERAVIDLVRNHRINEALDQAIKQPLEKDGIDLVAIVIKDQVAVKVEKDEGRCFATEALETIQLEDVQRTTHLHLVAPSFQGGDKWRVNDGGSNFYVGVNDQGFIERVLRGEIEFGASTILKVALREVQSTDAKGTMKKECTIERVLEVIKPHEQLDLIPPSDFSL